MKHGHVTPNPDGSMARCGGPALCSVCQNELAELNGVPMTTNSSRIHQSDIDAIKEAINDADLDGEIYANAKLEPLRRLLSAYAAVEKEREELDRLNRDKFRTIQAYCKAASEDKARLASVERVLKQASNISVNARQDYHEQNDADCLIGGCRAIEQVIGDALASLPPSGEGKGKAEATTLEAVTRERDELREKNTMMGKAWQYVADQLRTTQAELAAATAREAGMREALEFYAEPTTYLQIDVLGLCGFSDDKDERGDYGKRARAALSTPQPATPQTRGEGEGVELDPMVLRWSPERAKARRLVKAMNDTPPDSGAGAEVERLRAVVEKLPSEILGVVCRVPHHENYYGSYTRGFEKAREEIAAMVKSAADSAATQGEVGNG